MGYELSLGTSHAKVGRLGVENNGCKQIIRQTDTQNLYIELYCSDFMTRKEKTVGYCSNPSWMLQRNRSIAKWSSDLLTLHNVNNTNFHKFKT